MLTSVTLRNFKSYREATLSLSATMFLIGANASGKSNAIEGIRLLSWLAKHRKLACFLAKNYDVIYIPNYRVKKIYNKEKSNKTNRKNQLNWGWHKFVKELEYRCAKHGSVAIIV